MKGDAQKEATHTHMLSASAHILARLQRCHQTRRLLDSKLGQLITRAISLREAGKLMAAAEVEKDITLYLERQKELGRTTDQTVAALTRALREDQNGKSEISVTISVKGGTPAQKAHITNQVARSVQKAVKAKVIPLLATVPTKPTAVALPVAALLTLLVMGGLSSHATSLAAGFHCSKISSVRLGPPSCPRKMTFSPTITPRRG